MVSALLACALMLPQAADPGRKIDRSALWQRTERNVLWGFRNMYQPHVIHEPDAPYPFKMWFFGWATQDCNPGFPGCDAIYFARGKSLEEWEVYAGDGEWDTTMAPARWTPVVAAEDKPWDQWHNGDPSVVRRDGVYYMAYSATGFGLDGIPGHQPGDADGDVLCIMGATSTDGIQWTKSERPILMYDQELDDPGDPERDHVVEFGWYHRPSLLWDQGKWRLWFDYWAGVEREGTCMGVAECEGEFLDPDAWHLVRAGAEPVLVHWPNPDVVKVRDRYYAYSDPYVYGDHPWQGRQIAEAASPDGLNWTVLGYVTPDSDAPANHIPEALVLEEEGRPWLVLFYACQIGGDPYDYRYDRVRYMKRPVE